MHVYIYIYNWITLLYSNLKIKIFFFFKTLGFWTNVFLSCVFVLPSHIYFQFFIFLYSYAYKTKNLTP